jgi:ABC-type nitrate/sulfonate/bicarbonate transport system substrate-binding protein
VIEPPNYGYLLYARRELLQHEPELVARMVHDYSAAVKYAVEHLDEAARTLEGRIFGITREDIDNALRRDTPSWTWDTDLDRAFLDRILLELRAQSVVTPDFDARRALAA